MLKRIDVTFILSLVLMVKKLSFKESMEKLPASKAPNYKFSQMFGYKGPNQKIMEEDIISSIKFDQSGNYLAVGDKAGRVIVFEGTQSKKGVNYEYFTEFQSHLKEFDPLRSMEVEEEIIGGGMRWMKPQGRYLKMVTANSRSIKLWKMFQKSQKKVVKSAGKQLSMPKLQIQDTSYVSQLQKTFPCRHGTPINSLSLSRNEQYILSSDQSQVYLWSLDKPNQPFMLTNYSSGKAQEQDPTKQLITCSQLHPTHDNIFAYGMSKGTMKMCDLRVGINNNSVQFGETVTGKNYIYQLLASHNSLNFIKNGKFLVSRDCLSVKLWDTCNPKKPISTVMLNDALKSKLCQMVQNQSIFDKFSISSSADSSTILTGTYNNAFHLVDIQEGSNAQYQLNYKKTTQVKMISNKGNGLGRVDYGHKVIAGDFSSKRNMIAVASKNCFFTYTM